MINNIDIIGHILLVFLLLFFVILFTLTLFENVKLNLIVKLLGVIFIIFFVNYTYNLVNNNKDYYKKLICFNKNYHEEVPIFEPFRRYANA